MNVYMMKTVKITKTNRCLMLLLKIIEEFDVKKKFKTLRATYNLELEKIEKSTRSGAGTQDVNTPKLIWFKEMEAFIKGVTLKRNTNDNLEPDTSQLNTENQPSGSPSQKQSTLSTDVIEKKSFKIPPKKKMRATEISASVQK